jgi:site-specific recombinase XerD
MTNSFSLLFHLRKPKQYHSGPIPIYLRITVDGQRAEYSTHRECEPAKWNGAAGRMTGSKEQARELNAYLDSLVSKIHAFQTALINNSIQITADKLKNKLTGKEDKSQMLVPIFEYHNSQLAQLVGREYSPTTLIRYRTSLQHVINFMKWKYQICNISIRDLNHQFITDYDFYLRSERNCNNNTTAKYIKNFRKVIRICISNGWLDRDPFINFKIKIKEPERAFLSGEDIKALETKIFVIPRLNQVKDIFLFSCYTGLAYVDVKKLTKNNVVLGIDGNYWIHTTRTKTETRSNIPLLPPALALMRKYEDHPQANNQMVLLPILSNQKMNAYLKEIADICGIHKELTYHCARHTFATTVTLSAGVSIESVSKMLGHKNLRTTQHYAKILDQKVSNDMSILFNKYKQDEEKDQNSSIAK